MKKNYIAPTCTEYQVRPIEMLAQSLTVDNGSNNNETDEIGGVKEEKGNFLWN